MSVITRSVTNNCSIQICFITSSLVKKKNLENGGVQCCSFKSQDARKGQSIVTVLSLKYETPNGFVEASCICFHIQYCGYVAALGHLIRKFSLSTAMCFVRQL